MEPTTEVPEKKKRGGMVGAVIAIIVLLLLGGAVYLFMNSDGLSGGEANTKVLATVNGFEVTESLVDERLARARTGLESSGTNLSDPQILAAVRAQALDQIINEELVLAEAAALGLTVTDEELGAAYEQIRVRFETEVLFTEELAKNNFTADSLRGNIRRELMMQKYIDQKTNSASIVISEEEVVAFYENLNTQSENVPPLEELKEEIEGQLKSQKVSVAIEKLVEELRAKADIKKMEDAPVEAEPAE